MIICISIYILIMIGQVSLICVISLFWTNHDDFWRFWQFPHQVVRSWHRALKSTSGGGPVEWRRSSWRRNLDMRIAPLRRALFRHPARWAPAAQGWAYQCQPSGSAKHWEKHRVNRDLLHPQELENREDTPTLSSLLSTYSLFSDSSLVAASISRKASKIPLINHMLLVKPPINWLVEGKIQTENPYIYFMGKTMVSG